MRHKDIIASITITTIVWSSVIHSEGHEPHLPHEDSELTRTSTSFTQVSSTISSTAKC